jgi:hypothetical protein
LWGNEEEVEQQNETADINEVLAFAWKLRCSLALFVDEAQSLLNNETDWPDLLM